MAGLLSEEEARVMQPVTLSPGDYPTPYSSAKDLLVNAFSRSIDDRLEKAFGLAPSWDEEKPSQFLSRIKLLIRDAKTDDILQWMVRRQLPGDMRVTLANDVTVKTSDDLVKKADALIHSSVQISSSATSTRRGRLRQLCSAHQADRKSTTCTGSQRFPCPLFQSRKSQAVRHHKALENGNDGTQKQS